MKSRNGTALIRRDALRTACPYEDILFIRYVRGGRSRSSIFSNREFSRSSRFLGLNVYRHIACLVIYVAKANGKRI
jgi:hypothetical protein